MSGELKDLIKPPFANYDIVVYFGCGLFSLPLIYHYLIEPSGYRFPRFEFKIGIPIADTVISTLSLLFSVYVLGHIIAYVGSIIIEKSIDAYFGKVSSAILISNASGRGRRSEIVNAWLYSRFRKSFQRGRRMQNAIRLIAHAPVLPLYGFVAVVGGFDYYKSRIPNSIMKLLRTKMRGQKIGPVRLHSPWYKPLEHVVTNGNQIATTRMYNYLVISGTFRSLSLLFLGCIWLELYYCIHAISDGHFHVKSLMSDENRIGNHLLSLVMLYTVYGFSIASYMKFSRRYAEEAIFAYVLSCKDSP